MRSAAIFTAFATTATATVTTAAIATTATTAAGPFFARTGFIDRHGAAVNAFAVQRLDCSVGAFFGFHGNKSKTAGTSAEFIHDQVHLDHIAVCGKEVLQLVLGCVEGKISDKQFRVH